MAEIRVNNDNKGNNNRSIWPWILGALILVGLIWGIAELSGDDDREVEANRVETIDDREYNNTIEEDRVRNENYEDETMRNERTRTQNQDDMMQKDETIERQDEPVMENQ